MKLKLVVVDLELSKRMKRVAAAALVPALVLAGGAIAYANVPHTWNDKDVLMAAALNGNFADLDTRITPLEAARGKASYTDIAAFSVPPTTWTTVPYVTKLHDDRGEFDAASHAFTAKTAGDYEVCANLLASQNVINGELDVFRNGARERGIASSENSAMMTGCYTIRLAAGDVIDVRVYQTGMTTILFANAPYWDWITIYERR
jgi:hypothetical protein